MDKNFKWRTDFAKNIFYYRYAQGPDDTWPKLCRRLVEDVCGSRFGQEAINLLSKDDRDLLVKYIIEMKFIPGGRYLYYSGRPKHFFNNCFSFLAEEDTREEWARLVHDVTACLMSGGGVGVVYDVLRPSGYTLHNTGGTSSGPLSLMKMINEIGRYVIQGGSRRCLPEWAPVQMYDGTILPIKNIEVGDLVHTRFGPKKVINKFDQGKQQVYKIETNTGDLFSTKNHRWWGAGKDRTPRWVTTANIKRGYKIYREYAKKLFGIPIDTNWAYTLGFFLGNGCAYSSGYTHEVTFQLADKHITEGQIATILLGMETVTDAKPTIRKGHGACTEIRYRRRTLVKEFQKYKKPHTMFTIPYEIKNGDLETRSAFLAGWFDADGDIRKDNIIRLSNKYEHTLLEARILLKTLGIYSRLNKVGNIYSLNLSARQINRFKETIGKYSHKYDPRSSDNAHQPNLFSIVKSVEPYDICQTYDLEIEDVHEFVAFDHISHNSALWAGLNWQHEDIYDFLVCKDYPEEHRKLKEQDFNFPLPMDMTNISINWDTDFAEEYLNTGEVTNCDLWMQSVRKMMKTGEPGHAYNFYENEEEVGRNACNEYISDIDSNVCNLGSINFANIQSLEELGDVVYLASKFLYCGTIRGEVPTEKIRKVRDMRRQLGMGVMGIHEWLLARGHRYEMVPELEKWFACWKTYSEVGANEVADKFSLPKPHRYRAIAPAGTIGILASTTTGIEPMYAVAYKRRFIVDGNKHKYQYVVDATAQRIIDEYGIAPDKIETASDLAFDPERRVKFQADVQRYVDMGISSTINLPAWGTEYNNEDRVQEFANIFAKYATSLRGITVYPDGARGGQPLNSVPYEEAKKQEGYIFDEAEEKCSGGICSI